MALDAQAEALRQISLNKRLDKRADKRFSLQGFGSRSVNSKSGLYNIAEKDPEQFVLFSVTLSLLKVRLTKVELFPIYQFKPYLWPVLHIPTEICFVAREYQKLWEYLGTVLVDFQ